jgi:hypothetical protein
VREGRRGGGVARKPEAGRCSGAGEGERRREEKGGGKRKKGKKEMEKRKGGKGEGERKENGEKEKGSKKGKKRRRVSAIFAVATATGRPRVRDIHALHEEKKNRIGADRGKAVARGRRTAERCGMGQWSSSVSVGRG